MEENKTIQIKKKDLWKYSTFAIIGIFLVLGIFSLKDGGAPTGKVILGGPGETVEIKTIIKSFQYNPDVITVKKGSKVKLTIENKDNVVHGLHLPQFGVVDSQPALGTKTIEFIAIETPSNGQPLGTCSQEHGEKLTFNII